MASFRGPKAFLSNFFSAPVYYDGVLYPTTEHAFVAAKTLDMKQRAEVLDCSTPAMAKKIGKTFVLRADWENVRVNIMKELVFQKFYMYPELRKSLLAIEGEIVEENEWHDNFWGECLCPDCVDKPKVGNNLGKILMKVRDHLRKF